MRKISTPIRNRLASLGKRAALLGVTVSVFTVSGIPATSEAGVTGYVTVHNSRSSPVRVLVNWGFRGRVDAQSSRSFLVGDDEDATTWVTVETPDGYELKRFSYGSGFTDVDIWVD